MTARAHGHRSRQWIITGITSGAVGTVTWIATMATAPRYSYGGEQDMGSNALFVILLAAALVGGWLFPRSSLVIATMLVVPALVLAPWTAPRGDNDGLWTLILPLLIFFGFVLGAFAWAAGWVRERVESARGRQ